MLVCVVLSCLFIAALWSHAWMELTSWLPCVLWFLVFCHFPKCVLVHIRIGGGVGAVRNILLAVPGRYFFCGYLIIFSVLCLLCLCARLFVCFLWPPAGKGLTSWLSFVVHNCKFCHFPHWYPWSGVVLDCIDS